MNVCKEKEIPAYLERSRSGKGGHVWIFFDQPCPAIISRKVIATLIEQSGIISVFEKAPSFDRLFPNQDRLSGKGLGNLIALPLYKPAWEHGNSCFVDEQLQLYPDQWDFLSSVQRLPVSHLKEVYNKLQRIAPVSCFPNFF